MRRASCRRRPSLAVVAVLLLAAGAAPAPAASPPGADRVPLLTIESSIAFPAACDTGGCAEASQQDVRTFVFRDGAVLRVAAAGTEGDPFSSQVVERRLTRAALAELRSALSRFQIDRLADCAAGGPGAPAGEETWTWYGPGGAYNRFRVAFPQAATGRLPICPQAVQDFRFAAYFALR